MLSWVSWCWCFEVGKQGNFCAIKFSHGCLPLSYQYMLSYKWITLFIVIITDATTTGPSAKPSPEGEHQFMQFMHSQLKVSFMLALHLTKISLWLKTIYFTNNNKIGMKSWVREKIYQCKIIKQKSVCFWFLSKYYFYGPLLQIEGWFCSCSVVYLLFS